MSDVEGLNIDMGSREDGRTTGNSNVTERSGRCFTRSILGDAMIENWIGLHSCGLDYQEDKGGGSLEHQHRQHRKTLFQGKLS